MINRTDTAKNILNTTKMLKIILSVLLVVSLVVPLVIKSSYAEPTKKLDINDYPILQYI